MKRFLKWSGHVLVKGSHHYRTLKPLTMKELKTGSALLLALLICFSISCDNVNPDENPNPDDRSLNFQAFTNVTGTFSGQDLAFLGDAGTNSLYLAYKVFQEPASDTGPVNIKQINLDNREESTISYIPSEFPTASRQLLINGDQLHMVGGRMLTTFSFPLSTEIPSSQTVTGTHMSRFGAFMRKGNIYTIGGRTGLDSEGSLSGDAISQWNEATESFDIVANLPTPRFWADAELIGEKVYLFGGQNAWQDLDMPQNSIYVYDFATNSTSTFSLPKAVNWTYTAVYGDKIIVGGLIRTGTTAADADLDIFLGFFDTASNEFVEVNHNLSDDGQNTLYDIAVVNDKLYVLHGERTQSTFITNSWTVYVADLGF